MAAFGWQKPAGPVLLVDIECGARQRLAQGLRDLGATVLVTHTIAETCALARLSPPTLVAHELRLADGSGIDLLTELRPRLPSTRFVVVTSHGSVASAVRAMRLGAHDYLCKPVEPVRVLRAAQDDGQDAADPGTEPGPSLTLDQMIWEHINFAIETSRSLSEAARRLGLWRQSLKRKLEKYRPPEPPAPLRLPACAGDRWIAQARGMAQPRGMARGVLEKKQRQRWGA